MNLTCSRTLRRLVHCTFPLWICAAAPLLADVTVRYQTEIKLAPSLPPQAQEQMKNAMQSAKYTIYMKDGKGMAAMGAYSSMLDYIKQQFLIMDTNDHTYAILPSAELTDKMIAILPSVPEEAKKAMSDMKIGFEKKTTGRTDTILGIQAEEREMTLSMDMPLPGGAPQSGMSMKMVVQFWTAKPEEAQRNQAVRELMGYSLYSNYFMNPAAMMQKMTAAIPGLSDALKSMVDDFVKNRAVMLRTRTAMYMQMPPEVLQKLKEQGGAAGAMDFSGPLSETIQEAVEVSSAPVQASVFEVPADYKAIDAVDLLKKMIKSQMGAMAAQAK